jgi:hypothetical protein
MWNIDNPATLVPLGAFLVAIVAIIAGAAGQAHSRRVKAEQRMAMLARGVPLAEIDAILNSPREIEERPISSPMRRMGNSRRAAMVLISVGLGLVLFGIVLTVIVGERDVMATAASGLIPLAIGIGFLADYNMQKQELIRFGSMHEDEKPLL